MPLNHDGLIERTIDNTQGAFDGARLRFYTATSEITPFHRLSFRAKMVPLLRGRRAKLVKLHGQCVVPAGTPKVANGLLWLECSRFVLFGAGRIAEFGVTLVPAGERSGQFLYRTFGPLYATLWNVDPVRVLEWERCLLGAVAYRIPALSSYERWLAEHAPAWERLADVRRELAMAMREDGGRV